MDDIKFIHSWMILIITIILDIDVRLNLSTIGRFSDHDYLDISLFSRLWAIDANWRHIRNVCYRRLTPNGVKAVFFAFFVHSARLLRSTSGLWLAADRRY